MIICFSGTGNSLWVARRLAQRLGERLLRVDAETYAAQLVPSGAERVVWVTPVHSWGLPPEMMRVVREVKMQCGQGNVHHLVLTCGDDCGLAHRMWARAIRQRGWRRGGMWSVTMPNTYTAMRGFDIDAPEVAAAKIEGARRRVVSVGNAIADGLTPCDVTRGRWPWVKTRIIYPWFKAHCMDPAKFTVDAATCTGCGACRRACPMANIHMADGRPVWGRRCTLCLACYHACPTHSVAWSDATHAKGQYRPHF